MILHLQESPCVLGLGGLQDWGHISFRHALQLSEGILADSRTNSGVEEISLLSAVMDLGPHWWAVRSSCSSRSHSVGVWSVPLALSTQYWNELHISATDREPLALTFCTKALLLPPEEAFLLCLGATHTWHPFWKRSGVIQSRSILRIDAPWGQREREEGHSTLLYHCIPSHLKSNVWTNVL